MRKYVSSNQTISQLYGYKLLIQKYMLELFRCNIVGDFEIKCSPLFHGKSGIDICILPEFDAVYQRNSTTATPTNTVTHRQQEH